MLIGREDVVFAEGEVKEDRARCCSEGEAQCGQVVVRYGIKAEEPWWQGMLLKMDDLHGRTFLGDSL